MGAMLLQHQFRQSTVAWHNPAVVELHPLNGGDAAVLAPVRVAVVLSTKGLGWPWSSCQCLKAKPWGVCLQSRGQERWSDPSVPAISGCVADPIGTAIAGPPPTPPDGVSLSGYYDTNTDGLASTSALLVND